MTNQDFPNMAKWDRVISLGVGAALVAYAWKRRRLTSSAMTAGLGFIARGATGSCPGYSALGIGTHVVEDPRRALAGPAGIRIKEEVVIRAEAKDLFRVWEEVENLPVFMDQVEKVERLNDATTRWTVRAPGGFALTWDAEVINRIEPRLIAWKSLPGSDVVSAGSVRFEPLRRGGTQVTVSLQYAPPLGRAGAFGAWISGHDPRETLRRDLQRLKRMMETSVGKDKEKKPGLIRRFGFVREVNV